MSNYRIALKSNQDRIAFLKEDLRRQMVEIDKDIAEKERSKQTLLEATAILTDYERLMVLELAGK